MNEHSKIPQVDHLILLVGGNPLPNVVAGMVFSKQGGKISLIHSKETAVIAQRLQTWFRSKGFTLPDLRQVDEADAGSITQGVLRTLGNRTEGTVGLHYTGGTKAMAVHAYRSAELWAKERRAPRPISSYLDARTLKVFIDSNLPEKGESSKSEYVGRAAQVSIDDLVALHGWSLTHPPITEAVLPETAKTLALLNMNADGRQAWLTWLDQELKPKCRRSDDKDWKNKTELKQQQLAWPETRAVTAVLQKEMNLSGELLSIHEATTACGYKEPKDFCGWLHGKWLEHYTLAILQQLSAKLHLHECVQNIETKDVQFDVDVVAMRGYQLFALSCSTDDSKPLLKSKLFEAYIRARQIGGDEARVALISCSNNPAELEREMRRDIDPDGRICVFGREQLSTLATELETWIQGQSQEM